MNYDVGKLNCAPYSISFKEDQIVYAFLMFKIFKSNIILSGYTDPLRYIILIYYDVG